MITSTLCFLDTETTSLRRQDRRIWNIGAIVRDPDGTETEGEVIVLNPDLTDADPMSLTIGHFWQRHPQHGGDPGGAETMHEFDAAWWMLDRVRPVALPDGGVASVHIVACVPNFDVWSFEAMFARHRLCWPGHYHLICAENVAVGALAARGVRVPPPWNSTELSKLLGVDPSTYDRHTALGDARWARDLYDAAMAPIPVLA